MVVIIFALAGIAILAGYIALLVFVYAYARILPLVSIPIGLYCLFPLAHHLFVLCTEGMDGIAKGPAVAVAGGLFLKDFMQFILGFTILFNVRRPDNVHHQPGQEELNSTLDIDASHRSDQC